MAFDLKNLGTALSGFSAGVAGKLPQWQAQQQQMQLIEDQETERRRKEQLQELAFDVRFANMNLNKPNANIDSIITGINDSQLTRGGSALPVMLPVKDLLARYQLTGDEELLNEAKGIIGEVDQRFQMQQMLPAFEAGDPFTLAKGAVRYGPDGEVIASNVQEPERKMYEAADGFKYWNDDNSRVNPNVTQPETDDSDKMYTGADGYKYWTKDNERVNPNITKPEEVERDNASMHTAAGYAVRLEDANNLLEEFTEGQTDFWTRFERLSPQGAKSDERQLFEQAQTNFIHAVLRPESGAAIQQSEFDNATNQYIPQPGDSDAVLESKKRNRKVVEHRMRNEAGDAYTNLIESLAADTEESPVTTQPDTDESAASVELITNMTIDQLQSIDERQFEALSEEAKLALVERLEKESAGK